jgi:hypothetical protein
MRRWGILPAVAVENALSASFVELSSASLAAAAALGAAAFVAVHLAADFLPGAAGILSSALLSHLVSPLSERRWSEGIYRACDEDWRASNKIQSRHRRWWRVRQVEEDELDEALLGFGTEKNSSSGEQSAHQRGTALHMV